ncbi:MAG: 2-isopropylmalate synthase [Lachnospiraceae bacterium]|nr:2-isopropylmalate synthase [Lachnospiraceae bacterium]
MKNAKKYRKLYVMPPTVTNEWVKKDALTKPPVWCSVDLRDGNQALIEPMSLDEKLEFFRMLVEIGFKEIEIGFPAASETEYAFARMLIEQKMIPEDVTVQVLTQAREHIIRKTFEAIEGAPRAIVHLYNSTSIAQREQVFQKDKAQIKRIAVNGAKLLNKLAEGKNNLSFQYSPESFHGTEPDYAVEVCNAVLDVWRPDLGRDVIINIPTTVECAMPHVFAEQIEYIDHALKYRKKVTLSVHPHNDRGCGVATAELAQLAGADRVEGTLFGNGERTGNVDIVTLALNLYTHGVNPKLDFSDINRIAATYERLTRMHVFERQPYAGQLVFTAFSGSHQDAIAKGFQWRKEKKDKGIWTVPYLPLDPKDIGREYDGDVIRINSQSGKGGVNYILHTNFGIDMPKDMQEDVSYLVKDISDKEHKELTPERIWQIFEDHYIHAHTVFRVTDVHFRQQNGILAQVTIEHEGASHLIEANGNGRLNAVSNCFKQYFGTDYHLVCYEEHALGEGSNARAVSYVGLEADKKSFWGVGIDEDIIHASIDALCIAVNRLLTVRAQGEWPDDRIGKIMNYIQKNYRTVTLDDLAGKFYLSKPYLSKYIREKSGMTFGENVKKIRLQKAGALLRDGNMKVERVAEAAGYQNVEHFNRLFKKKYGCTPIQYRTGAK